MDWLVLVNENEWQDLSNLNFSVVLKYIYLVDSHLLDVETDTVNNEIQRRQVPSKLCVKTYFIRISYK